MNDLQQRSPATRRPFMHRRILLIEDDPDIAALLRLHLTSLGAEVRHESDGLAGLATAVQLPWDLLLLDLSLPGCDGMDICRELSRRTPALPIIMLTARVEESDRIDGLDGGADDYLLKPFGVGELVARINALFRRQERLSNPAVSSSADEPDSAASAGKPSPLTVGDIVMDIAGRTVCVGDRAVMLTAREFDLLHHFLKSPGTVFRRMELLKDVWGHPHAGYLHTVNSHINRLRGKIEPDAGEPRYIVTVWGVGYKLEP